MCVSSFIFLTLEQFFPQPGEMLISVAAFLRSLFWIISVFPEALVPASPGRGAAASALFRWDRTVCIVKNAFVSHIAIAYI